MYQAAIVKAKRTVIGKENGLLKDFHVQELTAPLLKHLSAGIEYEIDDIILGNVVGPGGNVARLSALEADLPFSIPGMTIDRQCGAGLEAIRMASYLIKAGAGTCYLAGGVESTSTSPFEKRARFSPDKIGDPDMGIAAENVAQRYNISKDQQDRYSLLSHERSWEAFEKRLFEEETLPLPNVMHDEAFMKKRNLTKLLQKASPVFLKKEGTVTAANSCGINDGACIALVMEEQKARALGFQPVLRFIDADISGVSPLYPAIAPVSAIKNILKRNSLTVDDIDLFEINEAFAVKVVACMQELGISQEKVNIRGGALTLGHPYGASGAILATRLFYESKRRDVRYVIAALGSGGGIGTAVLFEVIK
ncbi:acetyl-CoA C-acyltransferase [Priestia megaterium]|uniref:acetyl-CoA C-acyltransferase n=1 Tax=Priestia megaterium TaxID=1404 RepID=UPI001E606A3D|nr:acetyl-CoA C-acyltransferase [Priestia megaterium]